MPELLTRLQDALADRYRIDREIGAGGMATVYLAQDLRHDRRVALKLLRPELSAVIGAERFLGEIKLTANLQHPHILPLFDSGAADGFLFYVMPFVEGESLRDRLTREKQLPVADAVRIAGEVASALDYAHRHGVVHRDIKPENILLHDGQALVADFGIALAASKAGGSRMTETGMSLGTPTYMSPEQAMGEREITARSDVYALGCVLYEMLTGDPPFTGSTAQAIVARVLTEAPRPLLPQRHTLPPHVEAAVLTALEKLPADRFATAAEFAEALTNPAASRARTAVTTPVAARPAARVGALVREPLVLTLAGITLVSLALAAAQLRRTAAPPPFRPVRFLFSGSDSAPVVPNIPWPAAISPDGATLVYAVPSRSEDVAMYARRSDQLEAHPIPGTINGIQPHLSPDGKWLAFQADNKEKKVRLDGSAPVTITEGASANGVAWTTTDVLVRGSTGAIHGLAHVSVAGGEPVPLTQPDSAKGELDHLWPVAHPDGRTIVFTIWSGGLVSSRLAITSLDDGRVTDLGLKGIRPLAVLDGALVYVQADGAVMAVPLDPRGRRVEGKPIPVLDPVSVISSNNGNSGIYISQGGALVTGRENRRARLAWVGADGVARPIGKEVRNFVQPRLAPDGRRIAVLVFDGSKSDIWIHDLETGTLSRLTTLENVTSVEWSPDGEQVIYSAGGFESRAAIWIQAVDAASPPERLVELATLTPLARMSPDRRWLVLSSLRESWDVMRVALDSARRVEPFSATKAEELGPRISPDGRWVALVSNESGTYEVYVRSFPEPTAKVQVSVGGANSPMWSADGTKLYYVSGTAIMQARLAPGSVMRVLSRDTAFAGVPGGTVFYGQGNFDVTRDGSRIVVPIAESGGYQLVVVPNWITEFRERMAASRAR
jgi:Tol biopolymer transport system component/tRNA A-37 threonylcarbamoyl transferase component Bud32